MDEKGVHSPLNAQKSTVSDKDTTSPVQTVAGKDKSNPLMAVTLPKSEDEAPVQTDNADNTIPRSEQGDDEFNNSFAYLQDAQNPNEDDDSGMSFDSIPLHNLDT
ncbi:hypothetical protein FXO38_22881 [Capsicum annuum]|nr:hypothetical protein FXO38_22881 [Capsicum annuum]KAF3642320.1 hypothetical protein FXO37_22587 [Capsicum annuum]